MVLEVKVSLSLVLCLTLLPSHCQLMFKKETRVIFVGLVFFSVSPFVRNRPCVVIGDVGLRRIADRVDTGSDQKGLSRLSIVSWVGRLDDGS